MVLNARTGQTSWTFGRVKRARTRYRMLSMSELSLELEISGDEIVDRKFVQPAEIIVGTFLCERKEFRSVFSSRWVATQKWVTEMF